MCNPNPGTDEALAQGCTCPVTDNHYGRGSHGQAGMFVYSGACPVHGRAQSPAPEEENDG